MQWQDEGYLISKTNYNENSSIIDVFTLNHGKCAGIVFGGSSRKLKKYLQIGNKIFVNFKSKNVNKIGNFSIEIIDAVSPLFFDNKLKIACLLSASSILKILLPEEQINKKIFKSYENLIFDLKTEEWILTYIFWEQLLFQELGYGNNLLKNIFLGQQPESKVYQLKINDKKYQIPEFIITKKFKNISKKDIKDALHLNKLMLMENFTLPNKLKIPFNRNVLENYYN